MKEIGIDMSREQPKLMTDEAVQASDVVVTMGCGDACPYIPGKRYLGRDVPDPKDLPVPEVRAIRDEIERRVQGLVDELDAADRQEMITDD